MAIGWDIKKLYFYLVCLVTLIMSIVGTVQLFQGIVDLVYPEPPYSISDGGIEGKYRNSNQEMTDEELKAFIEKERAVEQQRQKHWQVKRLVNSFALIVVALPIYFYHWRRVQRLEN